MKQFKHRRTIQSIISATSAVMFILFTSQVISQTRTTVNSGSYNSSSIWNCSCVPASTESIVISSGHTVSLAANSTINNVEIMSGATLNTNGRRLDVNGNFTLNGVASGSGEIRLQGVNTTINGTGEFTLSGTLDFRTGNKTISAGSDLSFTGSGSTQVRGVTLRNKGTYSSVENITGTNQASIWYNDTNAVVNAGRVFMTTGEVNASSPGNEVIYSRPGIQNIIQPATSYYHLTIEGSGDKQLPANTTIQGNLTLNSGNFVTNGSDVVLQGNLIVTGGILEEGSDKFTLSGNASQSISSLSSETFYDLEVNKSGGSVSISVDINVTNTLTLTNGIISTSANKILLGTSTSSTGTLSQTSGYISGNFERWLNSTGVAHLFPVGTSSFYRPVSVNFSNLTGGRLLVSFVETMPGTSGLPLADGIDTVRHTFTEGYWSLSTASSLTSTAFNLSLTGNGFTSYTINPSTRLLSRANSASAWLLNGSHVSASASTIGRNGLNFLPAQYCAGDTTSCTLPPPSTSAISGADSVCVNTLSSPYSVINTSGATYYWTITGGSQASGGNSNSVTVNWSSTGMTGSVAVVEYNGCEYGNQVTFDVDIHSIPITSITGSDVVQENQSGVAYSVASRPGYTYTWVISGGSQVSGGSGPSITVNWSSAGTGSVSVQAVSTCGTASAYVMNVDILSTLESVTSGLWTLPLTWDCFCIPPSGANVNINSGHTVTLLANTTAGYVSIESGATLAASNRILTVSGDLTNNGTYSGSNRLDLTGTLKTIYGNGSYTSHTGDLRFYTGVHYIDSGVTISKSSGDIDLQSNTTVYNKGSITVSQNFTGSDATSIWHNLENSSLSIGLNMLNNGTLYSAYTGNSITYNRTGNNTQSIKSSDGGQYYHLSIGGNNAASNKRLQSNTEILGDLKINTSIFDANTNNYSVNLHGNWENISGSFNERNGTVTFSGAGQVINNPGTETFFNLTAMSNSTLLFRTDINILQALSIASGSTIDVNDTLDYTISVGGSIQNNGNFEARNGLFILNGSTQQSINGGIRFYDLSLNNSAGAIMSSGDFELIGTLTLSSGNLATGGLLTLISDASGTARIAEITGGSISGNITMQRYIANDVIYWRMLSSAVSSAPISDWHEHFTTSGFTGADNPSSSFKSIQRYNESVTGLKELGYYSVTSTLNPIVTGEGYFVWTKRKTGTGPYTIDLTGPANTGNKSLPVTYTSSAGSSEDGWNLVGNPYPSSIDWNDANWTKTNINDAIYVYDPVAKQYASYVNGVGANGGSNIIPSSQAFWVQSNAISPALQATEGVKSATEQNFYQTMPADDVVRISIKGSNNISDEIVLRVGGTAINGFDEQFDARKIFSTYAGTPGISTWSDSTEFSINTIPPPAEDVTIPLTAKVKASGNYSLRFTRSIISGSLSCLVLKDKYLNIDIPITSDTVYSCYMYDTTKAPRFELIAGSFADASASAVTCFGYEDGSITATGSGSGPWDYTWKDDKDSILRYSPSSTLADTLKNLSPGKYQVYIGNSGICGQQYRVMEIDGAEEVISAFNVSADTIEFEKAVSFENLSEKSTSYLWNFGDGETSVEFEPSHKYKTAGQYKVELISSRGVCSDSSNTMLVVTDYTGINEKAEDGITIYSSGKRIFIQGQNPDGGEVRISIHQSDGRLISSAIAKGEMFKEEISYKGATGVLIVSVRGQNFTKSVTILVK